MQSPRTQFIQTYLSENPKKFSKHGLELTLAHLEDERRLFVERETASVMYDNLSTFAEVDYVEFFDKKRHDGSFSEDILDYAEKDFTDTEIRCIVKQHLKSQNAFVAFTYNETVIYDTKKSPRALFVKRFLVNHNPENEFCEEGLHVLVKYFDEDEDGADPEANTDEALVRRINDWYGEEYYDVFFYDEVAKGNINDIDPGDYLDDDEYNMAMKNAVQQRLERKRVFVGFTPKGTVVYCRGNYCDD